MTTHRERMEATLAGEIIDRPPVALWRHFPVDDQSAETLAEATLHFQQNYDFDLVKVTPASSFCVRDWGVEDEWVGDTEGTRRYTQRVIQDPKDWETLPVLDMTAPHLSAQLQCLRLIRASLGPDTPILQTVFSPLSQAKNLAGNETLLEHLRARPSSVLKGLRAITETTRRFIEAAHETGIDGVFYAIQHAQAALMSLEEYKLFGLMFDVQALEPVTDLWCNLLHLHGETIHFDVVHELPFQMVNWHDRESYPSLAQAQDKFSGVVCGGFRQDTLVYRDQGEVWQEAQDALQQTGGRRFLLGTGCVVPVIASHGNIRTARQAAESFSVSQG